VMKISISVELVEKATEPERAAPKKSEQGK
jgi:hypothetical protein